MKTKQILTIILFLISLIFYSQDIRKNIDEVLDTLDSKGIKYFQFLEENKKVDIKIVRKYLNTLRRLEESNRTFTGKFNFGFELNQSKNIERVDLTVGVDLKKGVFPGELNFNSSITVQLVNEKLVENLSSLNMSYDHHFDKALPFEGYGFIKRTSNNFLNINQRYEVGAGAVFNILFSGNNNKKKKKKILTKEGVDDLNNLIKSTDDIIKELKINDIIACNDKICEKFKFKKSSLTSFQKSYNRNLKVIKKRESKIRISFLLGLNYEVETTKDSLQLFYKNKDTIKNSFKPKNLIRVVSGPNLELKINELSLKSRLYFKLGLFDDYNSKVVSDENILIDKLKDYRVEWSTSATVKLSEKISFSGKLDIVYLNAPKRQFVNIVDNPLIDPPNFRLFNAANKYVKLKFGLTYKI